MSQNDEALPLWRIRYEGCPGNPRFRATKRRTASFAGRQEQAEAYAESLKVGLGVKILWIKHVPRVTRMKTKRAEHFEDLAKHLGGRVEIERNKQERAGS